MKKLIGIILVSFALSSCTLFQPFTNPVNQNRLAAIESSYGIALTAAVAYRNLRICKKDEVASYDNVCAYRSVIVQLQQADLKAQVTLGTARAIVKDNKNKSTLTAFDALNNAQTAVSLFKDLSAQYGVK